MALPFAPLFIKLFSNFKKKLLLMTSKLKDHFMGFHQLAQKLERLTPIISTLQDKQNEWSFYGFSSTGSKVRRINTKQFEWSFIGFIWLKR